MVAILGCESHDVEMTLNTCRLLLCEVGYQAGQHELLSESLGKSNSKTTEENLLESGKNLLSGKTLPSEIKNKVKEVSV